MPNKKRTVKYQKPTLHPRNKHKGRYDIPALVKDYPSLKQFLVKNKAGVDSVDFFDPEAVKALNTALLINQYQLTFWDVPKGFLCPPIPGRADYIHHVADLINGKNFGKVPNDIRCLDVGVGANCIYPIIGVSAYGWDFIGTDIGEESLRAAQVIVDRNVLLNGKVDLRLQPDKTDFFYGVLNKDEIVDVTICNPPFHRSAEEAKKGAVRKVSNLKGKRVLDPVLNFAGKSNELWIEGGEERFVRNMIKESKKFSQNAYWFTSLISKSAHLNAAEQLLKELGATEVKVVPMGQGNKASRLIAWTFLTPKQQIDWAKKRWS